VSIASTAAANVVNTATVTATADRNLTNNTASDPTKILAAPDLTITKTHTGSFGRGQTGTYNIVVRNVGSVPPTVGQVLVTDNAPSGLTILTITGAGWTCQGNGCARGDELYPGNEYPPITVTVAVSPTAPLTLTNVATVSAPLEGVTSNNSASDPTQILWEPLNFSATAQTPSTVSLSWSATAWATSYAIFRTDRAGSAFSQVGTSTTTTFTDNTVESGKAYLYFVRAADGPNLGPPSAMDLATTFTFTDDPIIANVTFVKAAHLSELRTAVNLVRALAQVAPATFAESIDNSVFIKASHIRELRTALDAARSTIGLPAISYIDPVLGSGYMIKASHIQQLRTGMK
jgi:uncharacterized repeat protein (TIGR01451 family)